MHDPLEPADGSTFYAIAHPLRRAIIDRLRQGDSVVEEMAADLNRSPADIEPHLLLLLRAGLLRSHMDDGGPVWSLVPAGLGEVDRWITPYRPFKLVRMADLQHLVESELRNGR
ncbi:hypothetical protein GCM10007301_32620 [Azorhizobium oxalatiphilum]|uniref:HTH arsR-type domain-containing protein n=1 Tax=Azorhizobium oxalatiphilum TaxID=980631 RepID=A0A917C4W8_9HYPH|nr:helix-turn-helix domain-containing protein [Azorhizobium oxalatiphilum]GGF70327.1 hypothetical protein GCM10007301_32620 [Azorhizobium oxalatiphilum]